MFGTHRVYLPHDDVPGLAMSRSLGDFAAHTAGENERENNEMNDKENGRENDEENNGYDDREWELDDREWELDDRFTVILKTEREREREMLMY